MNTIARVSFFLLALACCIPIARSQTPPGTGAPVSDQPALATPELIRQIQFMLLSVSIDPGPIDGNAQQFTNRAVRTFEERNGLPQVDLANGRPVPADFLAKLRGQVAQNLLQNGGKPPDQQVRPRRLRISRRLRRLRISRRPRRSRLPRRRIRPRLSWRPHRRLLLTAGLWDLLLRS